MTYLPFRALPAVPRKLTDTERKVLERLPVWPTVTEISFEEEPIVRKLRREGHVGFRREKDDPLQITGTMYAWRM